MYTRTSGRSYQHENVQVEEPTTYIDYGWFSHFSHQCDSDHLQIKPVWVPDFHTSKNA